MNSRITKTCSLHPPASDLLTLVPTDCAQQVQQAQQVARGASLVVDPVMVSTSGHTLLQEDAIQSLKEEVFPPLGIRWSYKEVGKRRLVAAEWWH